jgi:hypothetical protein
MMSTPSRRRVASRDIGRPAERELWARAAGRCEFDGCNRVLFLSPVTKERVNISEKAHIYAFSKDGTRGHGRWSPKKLNDIKNLILVCHDCHKKIDADRQVLRYPASRLQSWKADHERRISIVTGVGPKKKSVVVLYGANIGEQNSKVQPDAANEAIFPGRYPAEEYPVSLSMSWEGARQQVGLLENRIHQSQAGIQPNPAADALSPRISASLTVCSCAHASAHSAGLPTIRPARRGRLPATSRAASNLEVAHWATQIRIQNHPTFRFPASSGARPRA